jgi:secreted Zn-dependent insulinase-like peptidase
MVILKMKTIKADDNIILLYKDKYKDMLENRNTESPWSYADMMIDLIYPYNYHYLEQLNVLSRIDSKMICKRINTIIKMEKFNITSLWYGNINKSNIIKSTDLINTNMKIKYKHIIAKPIDDIIIKHPNKNEKNKCLMIALPCTEYDKYMFIPRDNAMVMILASILQQPVYGELRTKHQLGYMVGSYGYYDNINMYIIIKVQSDKIIEILKATVYSFMEEFKDTLKKYDSDKFNKMKQSVYDKLLEPFTTMSELNNYMLSEIKKEKYIFNRRENIAEEIKNIKLNDIIKLYHSIILKKRVICVN